MIASHGIEGYGHHVFDWTLLRIGIKQCAHRLSFDDLNDLAALVFSAMWASAVRSNLFMAVRAFGQLRNLYRIVCPAGGGTPLRMAALGIWHKFPSLSFLKRDSGIKPVRSIVRADLSPKISKYIPTVVGSLGVTAAILLVSVLAAYRADPFAILSAGQLHGQRQQHHLAKNFIQNQSASLVVADLYSGGIDFVFTSGFSYGGRHIDQIEMSFDGECGRFHTTVACRSHCDL
jgi:hypothetical protein